jgi:hypothetical protein
MIQKFCTAREWKELDEKRGILEAYRQIPRATGGNPKAIVSPLSLCRHPAVEALRLKVLV